MSVRRLAMPPAVLSSTAFKATIVKPKKLFRVSEYTVDKPYFIPLTSRISARRVGIASMHQDPPNPCLAQATLA